MKPNNSLEEDEEMVPSDDETLVSEITSLPMDGATKFSDHQDKSKHTSEPVHPKMFQKSQEQHIGGQPEMAENNVFYNKGNAIRASTSWNGTAIHPLTPRSSIDYQPQTLITVPPHTQETLPPPSVLSSDLLQADGLQSPGYQISTIPTSLFLPPLQSSSTDGHCSVFQQDPSYSSQIPYPVVPNTSMAPHPVPGSPHSIMANAASAPVEDNSQFGQSATSSSAIQAQSSADARKAFERLIPFLRTVNSGNLGPLLMSVIKATHDFKHVLGQPKIGVLTKLIYPGLFCKRLGRRGESKVHYIGWTWNESMVDKDTLSLLDLDVPELSEYFEKETSTIKACPSPRSPEPEKGQDITFAKKIQNLWYIHSNHCHLLWIYPVGFSMENAHPGSGKWH
ncbi:hypothetical protein JCM33374_g1976 [Metschnikowia sp. JCM 33374]|nr:hypothetical protein JCM33374_g1976 [Metschnikowia sp. JCM 33374]